MQRDRGKGARHGGSLSLVVRATGVLLAILFAALLFWLFPLKLLSRLAARLGYSSPCPASLAWVVDNPLRWRYLHPVLDRVGIRPGECVLELGPGPGAFTVEAARRVGTAGRLVAVDIQPKMIAKVGERVRKAGLSNVETHIASAYELPLEDNSVDRAFLITVLPEIPDRPRALAELRRVLKPGGILSITEEFPDPDYLFPAETIRLVQQASFALEQSEGGLWVYTANFGNPSNLQQLTLQQKGEH